MSKVSDERDDAVETLYDRLLPLMQADEPDVYGRKVSAQEAIRAALEAVSSIHEAEPVGWQHRGKRRGAAVFAEWLDGRNQSYDTAEGAEFEERRVYAHPAPISKGVTPLVPDERLEAMIGPQTASPSEIHDMAVELILHRRLTHTAGEP